jgi:hypothetical protein
MKLCNRLVALFVACILVFTMALTVFASDEGSANHTKTIVFGSTDNETYLTTTEPFLKDNMNFGKWTYLGGFNHSTVKVTGSFIQANRLGPDMWVVLRMNKLKAGEYNLSLSSKQADAHVYLQKGSEVADMEALVQGLTTDSDCYVGQMNSIKDRPIVLPEDGDYLLILCGIEGKHIRLSKAIFIKTGDVETVPTVPETTVPNEVEEQDSGIEADPLELAVIIVVSLLVLVAAAFLFVLFGAHKGKTESE